MLPLFKTGAKSFKNKLFFVQIAAADEMRFGFSISKKIAKNAVLRNKWRRASYRLLRKHIPSISSKKLVRFSFRALPRDEVELEQNLESILKEANLIR